MGGRHGQVDVTALCRGEEPTGCGRREPAVLGGKQRAGGGGDGAGACSARGRMDATGCDEDATDVNGARPLHWAAEHGRMEAVRALVCGGGCTGC
jgi:ankyrin repeat protein